jgi:hypothetical protein
MSIWVKILLGILVLGLLVGGLAFWMDLYGIRRGCLAGPLDQVRYQSAQDLYAKANEAVGSHRYAAANDLLDMALSTLGDSYRLGRGADETSEMVMAAKAAAARSELEIAARLKIEAMSRRVWQFQRKTRLSGLCRAVAKRWGLQ